MRPMPGHVPRLAELRGPQIADRVTARSIIVQPLGAIEQHGPHLPLNTDEVIATAVAEAAVARAHAAGLDVWLLPTLAYTKSNEHAWSAGTIWLSATTMLACSTTSAGVWRPPRPNGSCSSTATAGTPRWSMSPTARSASPMG